MGEVRREGQMGCRLRLVKLTIALPRRIEAVDPAGGPHHHGAEKDGRHRADDDEPEVRREIADTRGDPGRGADTDRHDQRQRQQDAREVAARSVEGQAPRPVLERLGGERPCRQ